MKKIDLDLRKDLLEKIDELIDIIYIEGLDLDYDDFKTLKYELENVQDDLIDTFS